MKKNSCWLRRNCRNACTVPDGVDCCPQR